MFQSKDINRSKGEKKEHMSEERDRLRSGV
jgi:hypothetical protein